jgi:hypothetical protein
MKTRRVAAVIVLATILTLAGLSAEAGNRRVVRGPVIPVAAEGTAFAALQPTGFAGGWGRIVVRDSANPNGVLRTVNVWLHRMEPRTEYLVVVDDVTIGTVATRPSGSGSLMLKSFGLTSGSVPDALPPADELQSVVVYGENLESVLEGEFSRIDEAHARTIYQDETVLEDVSGGDAIGMAKVQMKDDDRQVLKSLATHLEPGQTYSIEVDDVNVAIVTADDQGQAHFRLKHPDEDNPIPDSLLPVSDIVRVEWFLGAELVLAGSFQGAVDHDKLVGKVTAVFDDSFLLDTPHGQVEVITTPDTQWEDFDGHELAVGDRVKITGFWNDDGTFVADEVELKQKAPGEDCGIFVGIISSVSGEAFILDTARGAVDVITTPDTEWDGFDEPVLVVGDRVKVRGCWQDELVVAREIKLLDDDDDDDDEDSAAFCTQGMGGWGQRCNGNNVGCLRDTYFESVFPNGLCLGDNWDSFGPDPNPDTPENESCTDGPEGGYSMYFSSSAAVQNFLPHGGKPGVLTADLTDPISSPAGVFAGQLTAAMLNLGFDALGIGLCTLTGTCDFQYPPGTLGSLIFGDCVEEELEGLTVLEIVELANTVISGEDAPDDLKPGDLKDALEELNEAFEDCKPGDSDCLMTP